MMSESEVCPSCKDGPPYLYGLSHDCFLCGSLPTGWILQTQGVGDMPPGRYLAYHSELRPS
jgi:hypothetical protein